MSIRVAAPSSSVYCRPDCSKVPADGAHVQVFEGSASAEAQGLKPCPSCKPNIDPIVASHLVDSTVSTVNASIGLDLSSGASSTMAAPTTTTSASSSSGSTSGPGIHRHNRSTSSFVPSELRFADELHDHRRRRASVGSGSMATMDPPAANRRRSDHKADGDHARLVDEACRHIAAAAAAAVAAVSSSDEEGGSNNNNGGGAGRRRSSVSKPIKRKKRRGGVLGFKELASKAGLSPWHFHRVFRSVTGLTPKAYGEACWNALTNQEVDVRDATNSATNGHSDNAAAAARASPDRSSSPTSLHTGRSRHNGNTRAYFELNNSMSDSAEPDSRASTPQRSPYSLSPGSPRLEDETSVPPQAGATVSPDSLTTPVQMMDYTHSGMDLYNMPNKMDDPMPDFSMDSTSLSSNMPMQLQQPIPGSMNPGWGAQMFLNEPIPEPLGQMPVPEGTLPGGMVGPVALGSAGPVGESLFVDSAPQVPVTEPLTILEAANSSNDWMSSPHHPEFMEEGSKDPFLQNAMGTPLTEWVEPATSG